MSTDNATEPARRKLSVTVEDFYPHRSNTLYGFVTISIPELHLRIIDATVHQKNETRWIGLPAKPQVDRDGHVRKDDHDKTLYSPVIEFTHKGTRDAFSARTIEALLVRFPEAFDEGEEAA